MTTLYYTFYKCSSLTSIDVSNWNTFQVTNMQSMFRECTGLPTIYSDDSVFVTTAVTSGAYMFTSCTSIIPHNEKKSNPRRIPIMGSFYKSGINVFPFSVQKSPDLPDSGILPAWQ